MSTDMITAGSARELLVRASSRTRVEPADARAGAVFERVMVDGESFFVKRLSAASDWKMGNLGSHPDGRTVLLDWTLPGAGPACWDLCWYLALNRARLPEQKQAAIARFRAALESHGIATAAWWQEQLDLCLIGIMATFGWEKALGGAGELSWWETRIAKAVARQHIRLPR